MKMKRNLIIAAIGLSIFALFAFSGCSMPGTDTTSDASRLTGPQALQTLTHKLTYVNPDVMHPVVKWYFTGSATAPAGYHYKFTFSYFYHKVYDSTDPGSWKTVGTYNFNSFQSASVTVSNWPYEDAKWVKGRVTAYKVQNSNGAQTLLGTVTEPSEFVVAVNSD
jgi:hypothetical protein